MLRQRLAGDKIIHCLIMISWKLSRAMANGIYSDKWQKWQVEFDPSNFELLHFGRYMLIAKPLTALRDLGGKVQSSLKVAT